MQGDNKFWDAHRKSLTLNVAETRLYNFTNYGPIDYKPNIEIIDMDTISAMKKYKDERLSVCIHNFANGELPCAHLVVGKSQEEVLFRTTTLSTCLTMNFYPLNSNVLLSKGVISFNIDNDYEKNYIFDVLSSATIVDPFIFRNDYLPKDKQILKQTMLNTLEAVKNYDVFITGAWGCGLFNNPIYNMCQLWNECLQITGPKRVVFAIPDNKINEFKKYINI